MDKETIMQLLADGVISNEAAAKYFPELKESEDECIRKEILDYIVKATGCKRWIAWIEKQGEQKPALPKWKYKKDNAPLLRDSIILNKYGCVAKSPSGAIVSDVWVIDYDELTKLPKEEFEKQDEPNVCEGCNNVKGCVACVDGSEWAHIEESDSAWSEEDFIYDTLSNLTELKDIYGEGYGNVGKCIDWLRSLKERIQPQPKQEWSEDDEIRYKTTLDDLEALLEYIKKEPSCEFTKYHLMSKDSLLAAIQKDIDWFRTLKDRYTWKPSDEQIKALHDLNLTGNISYSGQGQTLIELYNNLKKLKE